jgi:hypothetical protein
MAGVFNSGEASMFLSLAISSVSTKEPIESGLTPIYSLAVSLGMTLIITAGNTYLVEAFPRRAASGNNHHELYEGKHRVSRASEPLSNFFCYSL